MLAGAPGSSHACMMSDQHHPGSEILGGGSHLQPNPKSKSGFGRFLRGAYRFLRICPWTFLLIISAILVEYLPASWQGTTLNYTMIVFALVVFVIEVLKGADIRIGRFVLDLLISVAGVAAVSSLITYEIVATDQSPLFYQWIVAAVVFLDAIISTTIAFSTALRNMSVGNAG